MGVLESHTSRFILNKFFIPCNVKEITNSKFCKLSPGLRFWYLTTKTLESEALITLALFKLILGVNVDQELESISNISTGLIVSRDKVPIHLCVSAWPTQCLRKSMLEP